MIEEVIAAVVTPMRGEDSVLDLDAVPDYCDYLAGSPIDGVFVLGTTGEGFLLSPSERREVAERYVACVPKGLRVVVHAGAQTTHETVQHAAHAAAIGADAVAVIPPPYYPFRREEVLAHFIRAATACAPTPFFLYEFAARVGYSIPLDVLTEVAARCPNVVGIKISNNQFDRVLPYLSTPLQAFVGCEPLIAEAERYGASGVVSGLACAFPEFVSDVARHPSSQLADRLDALRDILGRYPFEAALKIHLGSLGLPIAPAMRRPLRSLGTVEAQTLVDDLADWRAGADQSLRR